jgi:hypothetical protein
MNMSELKGEKGRPQRAVAAFSREGWYPDTPSEKSHSS